MVTTRVFRNVTEKNAQYKGEIAENIRIIVRLANEKLAYAGIYSYSGTPKRTGLKIFTIETASVTLGFALV